VFSTFAVILVLLQPIIATEIKTQIKKYIFSDFILMGKSNIILFIGLYLSVFFSCTPKINPIIEQREAPNGTIRLSFYLYMDETEVTVLHYNQFLSSIKKDSTEEYYLKMLPDAEKVAEEFNLRNSSVYFKSGKYDLHPIIGVTYNQALAFCKWRTSTWGNDKKLKNQFRKVEFTLPTKEEWQMAAMANTINEKFWWGEIPYKKGGEMLFNCFDPRKKQVNEFFIKTLTVKSFKPNPLGLYNMNGNVAEIIITKGISLGGSWKEGATSCYNSSKNNYNKPSSALGFRCIARVIVE
jgi:hypothetical protein